MKLLHSLISQLKSRSARCKIRRHQSAVDKYSDAWRAEAVPQLQWEIAGPQLDRYQSGESVSEFDTFVEAVRFAERKATRTFSSLLEIGCSSGYYGEVLGISHPHLVYTGIDYSEHFVKLGIKNFPKLDLRLGNITSLDLPDESYDVVVAGGVLLHVFQWQLGLSETCRVARDVVIIHRTPVWRAPTTLYRKVAYDQEMIEWTFNESELISEVHNLGFTLGQSWPIYAGSRLRTISNQPTPFSYLFFRKR